MDITIQAGPQRIETKVDMGFEMLYLTKARENGVNIVDMIFDKITMDMKSPQMSGAYSSATKNETDPFALKIAENFKGVLNNPVAMHINTKGEFTEVIDIAKAFPQIPIQKANELKEQMSNQFIQFPEKKVKLGERWKRATSMNQVGDLEYTYTLVGIDKDKLILSVEGKMLNGESATVKLLGALISGEITLDKKTGETLASTVIMDMEMEMQAQGTVMEMNMKAEIDIIATQL